MEIPIEIVVAIIVGVVTIIVALVIYRRSKAKRTNLVITGLCDSGKTLLFTQLVYGVHKQTHTSMKENEGFMRLKKGDMSVIDVPGHDRLRLQSLEKYAGTAKAVIFLVDSSTITKDIKDVAEHLYMVLTDPEINNARIPVLIACNKQDLSPKTKSAKVIQSMLEKELTTVKKTHSGALEGTDGSLSQRCALGKDGDDGFDFSQLSNQRVEFVECSARGNTSEGTQPDIDDIRQWIITL